MGHASNLHRAPWVADSGPMTTTRMTREPELVRIGSDIDLRPIQDLSPAPSTMHVQVHMPKRAKVH